MASIAGHREFDPLICELVELCDRYAGNSARDHRDFDLWVSRYVLGRRWAKLAAVDGRGERTIRRRVRRVAYRLRQLHGPRVGHPIEDYLYPQDRRRRAA